MSLVDRTRRRRGGARIAVIALLISGAIVSGLARAGSKEQLQSLDEQVQEIKSDVLGIAAEPAHGPRGNLP